MDELYVAAPALAAIVHAAEQLGVDRTALLDEAGLDNETVTDPERLIPEDNERALWEALVRRTGDTSVGIVSAQHLARGSFRALEYLVRTSENLGAAMKQLPKFGRLMRSYVVYELEEGPWGLKVISNREYDIRSAAEVASLEAAMATLVLLSRDASGIDWIPAAVNFRHSRHSADEAYAVLGPSVAFDQPRTELVIGPDTLKAPMLDADPALHDVLQRCAANRLEELPSAAPTVTLVRRSLMELLPESEPALEAVAETLQTSTRVLQRKLRAEGTTFRAVVERVRESIAKRYLAEASLTTVDVAMLLEYSDAPSFHRAFRRWTGMSPGEYRKNLAG